MSETLEQPEPRRAVEDDETQGRADVESDEENEEERLGLGLTRDQVVPAEESG